MTMASMPGSVRLGALGSWSMAKLLVLQRVVVRFWWWCVFSAERPLPVLTASRTGLRTDWKNRRGVLSISSTPFSPWFPPAGSTKVTVSDLLVLSAEREEGAFREERSGGTGKHIGSILPLSPSPSPSWSDPPEEEEE